MRTAAVAVSGTAVTLLFVGGPLVLIVAALVALAIFTERNSE